MEAVRLEKLSKTYPGGKRALKGVTPAVESGGGLWFLGPQWGGKDNHCKDFDRHGSPQRGKLPGAGIDPAQRPEKVHALAGVVTEHAQMYDSLTGLEKSAVLRAAFGIFSPASARAGRKPRCASWIWKRRKTEGWPPIPPECGSGFPGPCPASPAAGAVPG